MSGADDYGRRAAEMSSGDLRLVLATLPTQAVEQRRAIEAELRAEGRAVAWVYDDGGREAAGFRGEAGDCVARAIAIAAELDYRTVYDELARRRGVTGKPRSARQGIAARIWKPYLAELGFVWTPTMKIGSGCRVHLCADELPAGRLVARLSRHVCAVVDGVVHDTYDPSRGGTRCVYGIFAKEDDHD